MTDSASRASDDGLTRATTHVTPIVKMLADEAFQQIGMDQDLEIEPGLERFARSADSVIAHKL